MTYKSARWANSDHIGVLLSSENDPDLYVDTGPLYESALAGEYGDIGDPFVIVSVLPPEEIHAQMRAARAAAYREESDPLFFQAQRGDVDMQAWHDKVDEIRARYPYPE
jgi:hypothetical protein